jgi:hypothetical protein
MDGVVLKLAFVSTAIHPCETALPMLLAYVEITHED